MVMNVPHIEISLSYYYQTDNNSNFFICKNVSIDSLLVIDFLMIFALSLDVFIFLCGIYIFVNRIKQIIFFNYVDALYCTFQNNCNEIASPILGQMCNPGDLLPSVFICRCASSVNTFTFSTSSLKTTMPIIFMIR